MRERSSSGRRGRGLTRYGRLWSCFGIAAIALLIVSSASPQVGGAAFTTINEAADGTGHCKNTAINCNIYDSKDVVWLNGGPQKNGLKPDGKYFFAVLVPGGQPSPNDAGTVPDDGTGTPKNLSDDFDNYLNRAFTVANGEVSVYGGTHDFDNGVAGGPTISNSPPFIRLKPYTTTTNSGGVYILAICYIGANGTAYPVDPRDCKYDAFKVKPASPPQPSPLDIVKSVTPTHDKSFKWDILKTAPARVNGTGGSNVNVGYTIKVTPSVDSETWHASGTISVSNDNTFDVPVTAISDDIMYGDPLTLDRSCTIDSIEDENANAVTLPQSITAETGVFNAEYSCTFSGAPAATSETNVARVTWDGVPAVEGEGGHSELAGGTQVFELPFTWPAASLIDECVNVYDNLQLAGDTLLASMCVNGAGVLQSPTYVNSAYGISPGLTVSLLPAAAPTYYQIGYTKQFVVPLTLCVEVDNTGKVTTTDTNTSKTSPAAVSVCPSVNGLTMGYWQNKNGQGTINGGNPSGSCLPLYNYLTQFNPFKNLSTSTCGTSAGYTLNKSTPSSGIAGYVYDIIKAANAGGASMNAMLKGQMLATALSVYFSTSGLGAIVIDLTKICKMIDSSSGTGSCATPVVYNNNVGSVFITNGTLSGSDIKTGIDLSTCNNTTAQTSMSVTCLLWNAASWSNLGGTIWYGTTVQNQDKGKQGLAKDTFDAINNKVAVAAGP